MVVSIIPIHIQVLKLVSSRPLLGTPFRSDFVKTLLHKHDVRQLVALLDESIQAIIYCDRTCKVITQCDVARFQKSPKMCPTQEHIVVGSEVCLSCNLHMCHLNQLTLAPTYQQTPPKVKKLHIKSYLERKLPGTGCNLKRKPQLILCNHSAAMHACHGTSIYMDTSNTVLSAEFVWGGGQFIPVHRPVETARAAHLKVRNQARHTD